MQTRNTASFKLVKEGKEAGTQRRGGGGGGHSGVSRNACLASLLQTVPLQFGVCAPIAVV
eukprot:962545-Pleurochrysis_carterae.AAC.6